MYTIYLAKISEKLKCPWTNLEANAPLLEVNEHLYFKCFQNVDTMVQYIGRIIHGFSL